MKAVQVGASPLDPLHLSTCWNSHPGPYQPGSVAVVGHVIITLGAGISPVPHFHLDRIHALLHTAVLSVRYQAVAPLAY
jgi:hypothetical protein